MKSIYPNCRHVRRFDTRSQSLTKVVIFPVNSIEKLAVLRCASSNVCNAPVIDLPDTCCTDKRCKENPRQFNCTLKIPRDHGRYDAAPQRLKELRTWRLRPKAQCQGFGDGAEASSSHRGHLLSGRPPVPRAWPEATRKLRSLLKAPGFAYAQSIPHATPAQGYRTRR